MKGQNESNALDALHHIMPSITSAKYAHERSTANEPSEREETCFVLNSMSEGVPSLAVEHAGIEGLKNQATDKNRAFDIVAEIAARCEGNLPKDRYYYLVAPDRPVEALRRQAITRFVETISPWIVRAAPTLQIDAYADMHYEDSCVLLVCGGSHPMISGTIGRVPGRTNSQENPAAEDLWRAIEHGLGRFSRYKENGFNTVLSLQDISGELHPSMLIEIENDREKEILITGLVDYIIVFTSAEDGVMVGNVWKERDLRYDPPPFTRKFTNQNGAWSPMEEAHP
jgi:hypothetical protein